MINLAVIEIKDVIKYLVRITIILAMVTMLTRYFLRLKTEVIHNDKFIFLSCLDITIPSMKELNTEKEYNNIRKENEFSALQMALQVELGMIENIINDEKTVITEEEKSEVDDTENKLEEAQTGLETQVQESNVPQKYTTTYGSVKIKNETDIKLTKKMLEPNTNINVNNILIYHTHTCESYTKSEKYTYKSSGNFRTTDKDRSVVRVGTELKKYMENYGYMVIHDTTLYDYPAYNGSYERSLSNVGKILQKNENTEILFDIHRDAIRR